MKQNWNLLQELMTSIEEERLPSFEKEALDDARWLEDQFVPDNLASDRKAALRFVIDGHLKILLEIGAIDGVSFIPALGSAKVALLTAPRLTAHGHELLNALRQPKLWNAIKTCDIQTGLGLTAETLKAIIPKAIQSLL